MGFFFSECGVLLPDRSVSAPALTIENEAVECVDNFTSLGGFIDRNVPVVDENTAYI